MAGLGDISTDGSGHLGSLLHGDEERLEGLFKKLDRDGNGRIDIKDLSKALKDSGVHHTYAKKFIEHSDANKSGDVCLSEFIEYVREHEKHLRLSFTHIDKNKDGRIDQEELVRAFKDLGVEIDQSEALKLLQRMDRDGSLNISFDEWRDYLMYAPSTNIHDLIKYWRHSTTVFSTKMDILDVDYYLHHVIKIYQYLDIGEDMNVPDDFTQNEMVTGMWWRHLVAGGVAGAVSRTCTAPLDRLKVYLQVHGTKSTGIKTCLQHMLREGGFWSLWRGNGINVLKIAPESAIKFMAYEQAKRVIRGSQTRELSIYERFCAGSLAGGVSQTIIYPLEVMKTRLALRKTGQYKSIADAAKKIYLHEGPRSFYRGYVPNLLGIIPYAGIDLAVYETLKNTYLRKHQSNESPSVLLLLACGTISSTTGQVCSYPLALVRTRLQAQVITANSGGTISAPPCTMTSLIREIFRNEGVPGLYRGLTPNFMKVAPAVAISYATYERCRESLGVNMT